MTIPVWINGPQHLHLRKLHTISVLITFICLKFCWQLWFCVGVHTKTTARIVYSYCGPTRLIFLVLMNNSRPILVSPSKVLFTESENYIIFHVVIAILFICCIESLKWVKVCFLDYRYYKSVCYTDVERLYMEKKRSMIFW